MTSIAMCQDQLCPHRKSCYRFTATPKETNQVYGMFPREPDGSCVYQLPITKQPRLRPSPRTEAKRA